MDYNYIISELFFTGIVQITVKARAFCASLSWERYGRQANMPY